MACSCAPCLQAAEQIDDDAAPLEIAAWLANQLVDMLHDTLLLEAEFGTESAANAAAVMLKILDAAALALQRVHRNRPGRGLAPRSAACLPP